MIQSKTEIDYSMQDLKKNDKKKTKRTYLYWLLVCIAVVLIIFVLMLSYEPSYYEPVEVVDGREVSTYLTHVLMPQIYNGAQLAEPFDLVIAQDGINDIIVRSEWPRKLGHLVFYPPKVFFLPDEIAIVGTVTLQKVNLVVTVMGRPVLNEDGLLNIHIINTKIGVVNITPFAKEIAKSLYRARIAAGDVDAMDMGAKIAGSLLNDEAFAPIFSVEGSKIRIAGINIIKNELKIHFEPIL